MSVEFPWWLLHLYTLQLNPGFFFFPSTGKTNEYIYTEFEKEDFVYVVRAYYKLGLIHCWGWRESEKGVGVEI